MAFFADLTPHTYSPTGGLEILNVGWLDEGQPFPVDLSKRISVAMTLESQLACATKRTASAVELAWSATMEPASWVNATGVSLLNVRTVDEWFQVKLRCERFMAAS
jgi:hypothetical protein